MSLHEFYQYTGKMLNPNAIDRVTGKMWKDVRSRIEYPYSYDEFIQWEREDGLFKGYGKMIGIRADYSDRLYQFDPNKYNLACKEVFGNQGQTFNSRGAKQIESFLRLYHEKPNLVLEYVIEGCNHASGFPYWVFGWSEK